MDSDPFAAILTAITYYLPDSFPAGAFLALEIPAFEFGKILALIIALLCLIISGFISGSEIAYFSLTQSQLDDLNDDPKGERIHKFLSQPQRLLATILIANNLVNVTIVVLTNFALGPIFDMMSPVLSFILQTILLTFLILLFGEILPKLYSNRHAVQWAKFATGGMSVAWNILGPIAKLLVKSGTVVNKVVSKQAHDISTDDLSRALEITEGATEDDKEMLEGILKFGDTEASKIMTPRVNMTALDMELTFEEVLKVVRETGFARIPAYIDNEDQIQGILYSRDLLPYIGCELSADFKWQSLLREAYFVPESRQIDDLLEDFRQRKIHMAIVVDEYGGTQGVVTLEDVLEEIVGDIDDEYDEPDQTFKRLRDDTFIFEGRTPLPDFFRVTDLNPDDYASITEDVETVAGMLLAIKGDFPKEKEPLVYGRCRFMALHIEDHRILEIRVMVMPEEEPEK